MSDITRDEDRPALTAGEEADLLQYGAVSPMAIAALLLGLFSFLAMFQLLLLILPVLAVFAAIFALWQIARSEGALVGRPAALAGLALALLFASIAVSTAISRNVTLRSEARAFGDAWLQLVRQGELQRAHQLHLSQDDRQLPGASLSQYYARSDQARDELEQFFNQSPLEEIAAASPEARFQFQSAETVSYDHFDRVTLWYRVVSDEEPFQPQRFRLVVSRNPTSEGGLWRVVAVLPPEDEQA